jgi:DHA2 family multidrug resistance protein-like MFS transporter
MLALPFYLQGELGQTPLKTALYLTSWPLAVAVSALATAQLGDRLPSWMLGIAGPALLAIGLASAALLPLHADPAWLAASIIPCGLGFGIFQVRNNRTLFLAAPLARSASAGGMQGAARLTGQTSGSVILTLLFVGTPTVLAPRYALAVAALFACVAAVISAVQARRSMREPVHDQLGAGPRTLPFVAPSQPRVTPINDLQLLI